MPEENHKNGGQIGAWEAETLRATAFPSPDAQFDPTNWWSPVVGVAPETDVNNIKLGVKETQGTFSGARLSLNVQAARIDWTLTANPQVESPFSLLTLGNFEEKWPIFSELLKKWFLLSPPLSRLAFGTIVYQPTEGKEDSYRRLQSYLPKVVLDPASSDFIYRINRPRKSKSGIEGLKINRLSTWTAVRVHFAQFAPTPEGGMKGTRLVNPIDACRAEIDVNTGQEYEGQIGPEQSVQVFAELVELAREILRKGDQP